jgi:hypothetical protein
MGIKVELCPNVSCRFARCTWRSWKEYHRRPNTLCVSVGSISTTSPLITIAIPGYILRPIASQSVRYITPAVTPQSTENITIDFLIIGLDVAQRWVKSEFI